ncbi:unnamed protein product [Rotaria socialis]|uniref:Uncharacterized protein n=1 Tax=Rotaria socialis TaxID=392032 RepID=A0A820U578_9BILA|nr:unnamed protein product [Rotaria socialis]CAF4476620.1 unnamed protein product [Rotaria socialis]
MSTLTFSTTEKHKPLLICKARLSDFKHVKRNIQKRRGKNDLPEIPQDKTFNLIPCKDLGFKTNYEQDPVFAHHVHQIAALAFLQPNDVSQDFDDLYNSLPQMLHPLLDYFEDTYLGRNRTQGRAKPMIEIDFQNTH